jgi:DASH complex subunit SPC19
MVVETPSPADQSASSTPNRSWTFSVIDFPMASLNPSVASLRSSISLVESSIDLLDRGVSDLPRLRKVLATQQHFEPLPEPVLRAAQQSIHDEISPAIAILLSTAESEICQLSQREESLKARSELLGGRLQSDHKGRASGLESQQPEKTLSSTGTRGLEGTADAKSFELKRLRQKRERLQYAVARLELQSNQRERELRRSMAVIKE